MGWPTHLGASTVAGGDVSILAAVRACDPHAARTLWMRFSPLVLRIFNRMVGWGPDNEDFVQDVFLTVLSRVHGLRNPKALGPFVASIANFAARARRRDRVRVRRGQAQLSESSRDLVVTTDVESREGLLRFMTILVRLRPQERLAFALRIIEGKDLRETAAALGVSPATVKRRVLRARNRIALLAQRDPVLRAYLTRT
jgi:RNA polymerase sigma-70 factor (ECF subfamily)